MKLNRAPLKRQDGFTLLEVVVAMAIVGLGVVTLLELFSLGLRLMSRSTDRTRSSFELRRAMDESLIRQKLDAGRQVRSDDGGWEFEIGPETSSSVFASELPWRLVEVTVRGKTPEGDRMKPWEIKTLRLMRKSP